MQFLRNFFRRKKQKLESELVIDNSTDSKEIIELSLDEKVDIELNWINREIKIVEKLLKIDEFYLWEYKKLRKLLKDSSEVNSQGKFESFLKICDDYKEKRNIRSQLEGKMSSIYYCLCRDLKIAEKLAESDEYYLWNYNYLNQLLEKFKEIDSKEKFELFLEKHKEYSRKKKVRSELEEQINGKIHQLMLDLKIIEKLLKDDDSYIEKYRELSNLVEELKKVESRELYYEFLKHHNDYQKKVLVF